jgi:hypothetical protein
MEFHGPAGRRVCDERGLDEYIFSLNEQLDTKGRLSAPDITNSCRGLSWLPR